MDDAFRHQLESKEMKHREDMAQLEEERQMELERANQRVRIQINQLNATVKCIMQISQSEGKKSNTTNDMVTFYYVINLTRTQVQELKKNCHLMH